MLFDKPEDGLETANFQIEGLSCSCEGQIVEKRVRSLKGVNGFFLNPISFKMRVMYDPKMVTIQDIVKSVAKAGVKAVPLAAK